MKLYLSFVFLLLTVMLTGCYTKRITHQADGDTQTFQLIGTWHIATVGMCLGPPGSSVEAEIQVTGKKEIYSPGEYILRLPRVMSPSEILRTLKSASEEGGVNVRKIPISSSVDYYVEVYFEDIETWGNIEIDWKRHRIKINLEYWNKFYKERRAWEKNGTYSFRTEK